MVLPDERITPLNLQNYYLDFKNDDYKIILNTLSSVEFVRYIQSSNDIDRIVSTIYDKLDAIIGMYIPKKAVKQHKFSKDSSTMEEYRLFLPIFLLKYDLFVNPFYYVKTHSNKAQTEIFKNSSSFSSM